MIINYNSLTTSKLTNKSCTTYNISNNVRSVYLFKNHTIVRNCTDKNIQRIPIFLAVKIKNEIVSFNQSSS